MKKFIDTISFILVMLIGIASLSFFVYLIPEIAIPFIVIYGAIQYIKEWLSSLKESMPKNQTISPSYDESIPDITGDMFMSAKDKQIYLQSKEWKDLKACRLSIANNKCEKCGSKHSLQLHHISYQNLGMENITDVAILCSRCHSNLHRKLGYDRMTEYPIN